MLMLAHLLFSLAILPSAVRAQSGRVVGGVELHISTLVCTT